MLKLNSANEQYIPAGYGTPDPAYQPPTATPQLTTLTNSEPASQQTLFIAFVAVIAIAALASLILFWSRKKQSGKNK